MLAILRALYYNMWVNAGVMELVDVADSKSADGNIMWVRVPPPAPKQKHPVGVLFVLSAGQFTVNAVASHRGV